MTRKEQIKILDDKIESNINQYKVVRLNAEISAFSSGDLNTYEFLTRKDLKYKPNALDKAKFEFPPLGKAFSTGLDKTADAYQEEGVIKILKDIRDGLAGGINRSNKSYGSNRPYGPNRSDNDDDNDDDNYDDDDQLRLNKILRTIDDDYDDEKRNKIGRLLEDLKNDKTNEEPKEELKEDKLDKFYNDYDNEKPQKIINDYLDKIKKYKDTINNINEQNDSYLKKIEEQNDALEKLKEEVKNNKKLTKDMLIDSGEKLINFIKGD